MKSFLLRSGKPTIKWSMLPDNIFYEGNVPDGYDLAVCPSGNIVILDIDVKNGKNGYNHIPQHIILELRNSFYYDTKSGGRHCWIKYTGTEILLNKATEFGLDLRVGAKKGNAGGYVKYYHHTDIRQCEHLIKESSPELNIWLEKLFS